MNNTLAHQHHHDDSKDILGFWIYILSDCILFSILFAMFAVVHNHTYGGPSIKQLTERPYILIETILLLTSSFTYGMAMLAMYKSRLTNVLLWLGMTFILGLSFVGMEINEFVHICLEGFSWQTSAALSSFFTLVGTHGAHVSAGLIWMFVMMTQVLTFGLSPVIQKRLTYLGLFWAFLDVVWIFVYTVVYLMGSI